MFPRRFLIFCPASHSWHYLCSPTHTCFRCGQYQCALYFSINIGFRVGDGYVETKSSPERILFLFAMCAQVCLISYIASRCALGSSAVNNGCVFDFLFGFIICRKLILFFLFIRNLMHTVNTLPTATRWAIILWWHFPPCMLSLLCKLHPGTYIYQIGDLCWAVLSFLY